MNLSLYFFSFAGGRGRWRLSAGGAVIADAMLTIGIKVNITGA